MKLFDGQSSDGSSVEFGFPGRTFVNIWVAGDLGGGTVQLEAQTPDGLQWLPVNGGTITSPSVLVVDAAPFRGRLTLSGATSPDVDAWVEADLGDWRNQVREI